MIKVRGMDLPVNVKAELEDFPWKHSSWRGGKLIACSPFRDESRPSFAVNLETGVYIDSGLDDEDWRKGNFVKLLSWLRNEPYEDTEEYLIDLYSPQFGDLDKLELPNIDDWIAEDRNRKIFDKSELKPYLYKHPYLERRGIPFKVQRAFDVGYDPETKSVVIPWHDWKGNVVSWKHRHVHSKVFWYVKGGQPIRNHLYGIHWVVRKNKKRVWIVEAEIDALTLWSKGIAAVAIGSSYLSEAKRDLILKTGIEEIVIATDNDKDGRKAKRSIIKRLSGFVDLQEIIWDGFERYYKDINEARNELDNVTIKDVDLFGWNE
ncbi:toprim domain-containing protein [Bacillus andreraoultii]|uniref:toprim domain-containing protein n=2 Tax=Bacillus andreraoultii TaxID=1499685 RepID=UPI0005A9575C|nr:toprim domain-containing protein [Bacillus andreraoultii]